MDFGSDDFWTAGYGSATTGGRNGDDGPDRGKDDVQNVPATSTDGDGSCRESVRRASATAPSRENGGGQVSAMTLHGNCILPAISPDIDMTTAISIAAQQHRENPEASTKAIEQERLASEGITPIERLDSVPHLYTYSIVASMLPLRSVQNSLIALYFTYIHPMFPVVDEYHIAAIHEQHRGHEEHMVPADFMIYYAVMHISEAQLHRTPYRSVPKGQEALFDQVKAQYKSHITTDSLVLTQIALILSLWSPDPSPWEQNNSYWLDMAFKHANAAKLWTPQANNGRSSNRHRLIGWCCIVRDRHLALVLRRPYRLHNAPLAYDMVAEDDFGTEAHKPSFGTLSSKRMAMLSFIWLCKLSDIMEKIAVVQQRAGFCRDWNGDLGSTYDLEEVSMLDRSLERWKEEFEGTISSMLGTDTHCLSIPVTSLRIVSCSLLTVLYQPYLHASELETRDSGYDPLKRVKEGSLGVDLNVKVVMDTASADAFPQWMWGWILLPVAVYQVSGYLKSGMALDDVLISCTNQLARRFSGAQATSVIMNQAVKDLAQGMNSLTTDGNSHETEQFDPNQVDHPRNGRLRSQQAEASLLARVTRIMDSALEHDGIAQRDTSGTREGPIASSS